MRRARDSRGRLLEAAFQQRIESLAPFYGWSLFHPPDNRPQVQLRRDERTILTRALNSVRLDPQRREDEMDALGRLKQRLLGRRAKQVQKIEAGFPDLTLRRGAELIFAELKTETGRIRPQQVEWLDGLRVVEAAARDLVARNPGSPLRVEVVVWRPSDFDAIHERLAAGRTRVPYGLDQPA